MVATLLAYTAVPSANVEHRERFGVDVLNDTRR
jgi:hypothetical protein